MMDREKLTEALRSVDHLSVEDCFCQSPLFDKAADLIDAQAAQIASMNAVSLHQTDRLLPMTKLGGMPWKQRLHPLTCGNDSKHTLLFPFCEDGKVQLICRDCEYTQDNAAMHSVGTAP
jgi:hypothetical protein